MCVLTRDGNLCVGQVPPVGKPLAVVKTWKHSAAVILALQHTVLTDGLKDLQSMTTNEKVVAMLRTWIVDNVVPCARAILIGHPVIVKANECIGVAVHIAAITF